MICLNTQGRVQAIHTVYQGSLNQVGGRVSELFREAIRINSAGIILVHNHPSGDPEPSDEDIQATRKAVEAGRLLDIHVMDHVIIGQGRWFSLFQHGLGYTIGDEIVIKLQYD